MNPNCISYWYPKLQAAGVRTPETRILTAHLNLWDLVGDEPRVPSGSPAAWRDWLTELEVAARSVGEPCFLRAGLGSDKHNWAHSCFIPKITRVELARRVSWLVDWLYCRDLEPGPAWVFAVRRYVPLLSAFTAWRGLPIGKERRYFIRRGGVVCHHAYWPVDAFTHEAETGCVPANWPQLLAECNRETPKEVDQLREQTHQVALEFPHGYWSVDWACGQDGHWYCLDMAEGARSWHPPCALRAAEALDRCRAPEKGG